MNESPPVIHFELNGPPGSGKTALAVTWAYHLTFGSAGRDWQVCNQPTDQIVQQAARLARGEFFKPTVPSDGLPLDDPAAPKERLNLQRLAAGGRVLFHLPVVSEAGEETQVALRSGQVRDVSHLASRYGKGEPRILGLVLNSSLASPAVARVWLKAHVAKLCDIYESCDARPAQRGDAAQPVRGTLSLLRTAIEVAALSLYNLPAHATEEGTIDVHHAHPAAAGVFLNLPEDARLACGRDGTFRIDSASLSGQEKARILDGLDAVATRMADEYGRSLLVVKPLGGQAEQCIPVLTRFDVLRWLAPYVSPHGVREQCLAHFRREFPRDQVVEGDFLSVEFESDWQAVAAGQKPGCWLDTAKMAKKSDAFASLFTTAIDEAVARRGDVATCPPE